MSTDPKSPGSLPWAWLLLPAVVLAAYAGTWIWKVELGIVRPAANLRYFYYSDDERVDRALYVLYWPCCKASPEWIHTCDRIYPSLTDAGP